MENPIKDNRIVSNKTFAVRLLHFIQNVNVSDACSDDEKNMIIDVAEDLLRYQCKTATDKNEIDYLKRINVYDKYNKPFYVTEDGVELFEKQDIIIYSCMKKVHIGEQVISSNCRYFDQKDKKFNPNRLYFVDKNKCVEYIEMNKPKYSENDIKRMLNL
jgi:hypothetical protein